jgi:hypothetical protein
MSPVPLIVTNVPAGPLGGVKPVIFGFTFVGLRTSQNGRTRRHRDRSGVARNTVRCCQVIHLRLRSMKPPRPAARTRSATSSGGRFIYGFCGDLSFNLSKSRGLAVAWRCRRER